MPLLPRIEIEPGTDADASVIWLHGLGADGHDFEPIVPELNLPASCAVRFIFPHAPSIPVTINNGYVMPAWYDIVEMDIDRKVDVQQLDRSAKAIQAIIEYEIERGIKSERIVLAGFSQGGAVAYKLALNYEKPLAGLLIMSSYIATEDTFQWHEANRSIPIQIFHGLTDPVVPEFLGEKAYSTLSTKGYEANYKTYPIEHSVCVEEIKDISTWLQGTLI